MKYFLIFLSLVLCNQIKSQIVNKIGLKTGISKTELELSNNSKKSTFTLNYYGQFQIVFLADKNWELPINIGYINKKSEVVTGPAYYDPIYIYTEFQYKYLTLDFGFIRKFPIKWFSPYVYAGFRCDRLLDYIDDEGTYYGPSQTRKPSNYNIGMISALGFSFNMNRIILSFEISQNINYNKIYSKYGSYTNTVDDKTTRFSVALNYKFLKN
jgi:Outer membrane protein beta-barrel domain